MTAPDLFKEAISSSLTSDQEFLDFMKLYFTDHMRQLFPNRDNTVLDFMKSHFTNHIQEHSPNIVSTVTEPSHTAVGYCLKIMGSESPKMFVETIVKMGMPTDEVYELVDAAQRDYRVLVEELANSITNRLNVKDTETIDRIINHYSEEACSVVENVLSVFNEIADETDKVFSYSVTKGEQLLKEQQIYRLMKHLKLDQKKLKDQISEANHKSYFDEEDSLTEQLKLSKNLLHDISMQMCSLKSESVCCNKQETSERDDSYATKKANHTELSVDEIDEDEQIYTRKFITRKEYDEKLEKAKIEEYKSLHIDNKAQDNDLAAKGNHYCDSCEGTGKYIIGKSAGNCYRCSGKGFHNEMDRKRNYYFDRQDTR